MCNLTKVQKRIKGRWLESLGIGIVSGSVLAIADKLSILTFVFFVVGGIAIAMWGTILFENNQK